MKKRNIIIDCDPGIDDAFAIALALKAEEFNVLAIHTVAGNVGVHHTTRNTRGLVKLLGSDVEICQGASLPLLGPQVIADDIHGNNGFAGSAFTDDELAPLSNLDAFTSYVEKLSNAEAPIDIVAVGPLTNVAALLLAHPELKDKIGVISIMGGGVKGGNITPAGEFNFFADPEAAHVVFAAGVKIIMAGLDVTEVARIYEEDVAEIRVNGGKVGDVLATIVAKGLQRSKDRTGIAYSTPNDACSILVLIEENLFSGKELKIDIETSGRYTRGMSIADQRQVNRQEPNTLVLFEVDELRFRETMVRRLTKS